MAPGIASMMALSNTSMIAIETVSEASARPAAAPAVSPARSSGSIVSA